MALAMQLVVKGTPIGTGDSMPIIDAILRDLEGREVHLFRENGGTQQTSLRYRIREANGTFPNPPVPVDLGPNKVYAVAAYAAGNDIICDVTLAPSPGITGATHDIFRIVLANLLHNVTAPTATSSARIIVKNPAGVVTLDKTLPFS